MRKFIKHRAHSTLNVANRNITKLRFKYAYSLFRQDGFVTYVESGLRDICIEVAKAKDSVDPLLVKSLKLKIDIEYSQLLEDAA